MTYSCTPDNITRTITFILVVVFGGISLFQVYILLNHPHENILFSVSMLVIFLSVLLLTWAYAPRSYEIDAHQLTVKRIFNNYSIELSEIKKARILSDDEIKNTWRTFGNGGLFGVYGRFRNSRIGEMQYYAQRTKQLVLVELNHDAKKLIFSPDDREGFVKELNRKK